MATKDTVVMPQGYSRDIAINAMKTNGFPRECCDVLGRMAPTPMANDPDAPVFRDRTIQFPASLRQSPKKRGKLSSWRKGIKNYVTVAILIAIIAASMVGSAYFKREEPALALVTAPALASALATVPVPAPAPTIRQVIHAPVKPSAAERSASQTSPQMAIEIEQELDKVFAELDITATTSSSEILRRLMWHIVDNSTYDMSVAAVQKFAGDEDIFDMLLLQSHILLKERRSVCAGDAGVLSLALGKLNIRHDYIVISNSRDPYAPRHAAIMLTFDGVDMVLDPTLIRTGFPGYHCLPLHGVAFTAEEYFGRCYPTFDMVRRYPSLFPFLQGVKENKFLPRRVSGATFTFKSNGGETGKNNDGEMVWKN